MPKPDEAIIPQYFLAATEIPSQGMWRKPFCRKTLAHTRVSIHTVSVKSLLICCLMLQVTAEFLW